MFRIRTPEGELLAERGTLRDAQIAAIYEAAEHGDIEVLWDDDQVIITATRVQTEPRQDCP